MSLHLDSVCMCVRACVRAFVHVGLLLLMLPSTKKWFCDRVSLCVCLFVCGGHDNSKWCGQISRKFSGRIAVGTTKKGTIFRMNDSDRNPDHAHGLIRVNVSRCVSFDEILRTDRLWDREPTKKFWE